MWQDTTKGNGGANQGIQFFVAADRELQVAGRDALDLEILGCVACELEYFSSQVFEYGGQVDGGFGADARLVAGNSSEVALYATTWELY